jgi:hypothetical protein
MLSAIKDQKAVWASLSETQKTAMTTAQQAFSVAKPGTQQAAATGGTKTTTIGAPVAPTTTTAPRMTFTPVQNYARPGQRIPAPLPPSNTAAATATTGTAAKPGGVGQGNAGQAVPVMLAPGSSITVNLTGVCPHCGRDINHTQTDKGVSQGTNAPL